MLKSVSISDVFGAAGTKNSFSKVTNLKPDKISGFLQDGSGLFDEYPAKMSKGQSRNVLVSMLHSSDNSRGELVALYFKNHGDPFFGKLVQMIGRDTFPNDIGGPYMRTVFKEIEKLPDSYVQSALQATFPPDRFNVEETKYLGGGTVAETHFVKVVDKRTNKTTKLALKIYRKDIAENMTGGINRVTPLFKNAVADSLKERPDDYFGDGVDVTGMRKFYQSMVESSFDEQVKLNLGEINPAIERNNLLAAAKFRGQRSKPVSLLKIPGMAEGKNFPAIAMEYAEGKSFNEVIEDIRLGKLSDGQLEAIAESFADTKISWLKGAVSGKLIHADMNPGNFAVDLSNGQIITYDWGAASALDDAEYQKTLNFFEK